MRAHTYWKTYEDYLKWSFNPPKQPSLKEVHTGDDVNDIRHSGPIF